MKSFDEMEYHPVTEKLVDILCTRTQNTDRNFFRLHIAYYWAMLASMMRTNIVTLDRGELPVNIYAINLAPSGSGKGFSTNLIEEQVIDQFRHNFLENTFPILAETNLPKLARIRAIRKGTDEDEELERVKSEFKAQGPLVFSFDSGTTAAVRQARHMLLMADAGSMNLQIDEIGSNLLGNVEVLNIYLELYDVGKIKPKLLKNTKDNERGEEIVGRTPTNMMLFGTPNKLLNGGKVEEEMYSMFDTGYSRRCFVGFNKSHKQPAALTAKEVLQQRTDTSNHAFIQSLSDRLASLADIALANNRIAISEDVTLLFIEYQLECTRIAELLPEHEEMRKAEMTHRYFKAMKLAGAYAFIDGSPEITEDHAYYAIKMAETSGEAFKRLLTRELPYAKLAKYIADVGHKVTQADLVQNLPYYRGGVAQKQELLNLAIAYGYTNNILVRKTYSDGIEFLEGESLKETDLKEIRLSYSNDLAKNYQEDTAPFDQLHKLTQLKDMHWCNHHFKDQYRTEDNAIPGFNIVVLDVEDSVSLKTAQTLLKDYKALFYTTRRHTPTENRFRIIMPTNYCLELNAQDYKDFMGNLFRWLPFHVDEATGQRSRKWLTHPDWHAYQDGLLLDVLPFIPKTTKNEQFKQTYQDQLSLNNMERWFLNNSGDGNRNNMLFRYAAVLVDAGLTFEGVREKVFALNDKMPDKLAEAEILATVMVSVSKAIAKR